MKITAREHRRLKLGIELVLVLACGLSSASTASAQEPPVSARPRYVPDTDALRKAYQRADQLGDRLRGQVFGATLTPHWLAGKNRFWYRNDNRDSAKEFILVDAERGVRERAFDHERLAGALSQALDKKYRGDRLPFEQISFDRNGPAVQFRIGEAEWQCDLQTYHCSQLDKAQMTSKRAAAPSENAREVNEAEPAAPQLSRLLGELARRSNNARSPDGHWTAFVNGSDLYVRATDTGKEIRLTWNGILANAYRMLSWAPDSKTLLGCRVDPGDQKRAYMVESSPLQGDAPAYTRTFIRCRATNSPRELWLFEMPDGKATSVAADRIDFIPEEYGGPDEGLPRVRWAVDGRHFTYEMTDRGHQRFRIIEVEVPSGRTRNLLDEKSETFINSMSRFIHYTKSGDEILWASERDGWRHLYLIDARAGAVKHQITKGPWVVREVDQIDEQKRQIWFRGCGKTDGRDPYLIHLYRVNFDGTGLVDLTDGDGVHQAQYSPDRAYFIDTYSRVDQPPIHELRRASDGRIMCELERADASALHSFGHPVPESFHAKGRDGRPISGASSIDRASSTSPRSTLSSRISTPVHTARSCPTISAHSVQSRRWRNWALSWCKSMAWALPTGRRRSTTSAGRIWRMPGSPTAYSGSKHWPSDIPISTSNASASSERPREDRAPPGHCSSIRNSTRLPFHPAVATTIAWTRRRGTSNGWAIRLGRTMLRSRISPMPTGCGANSC